MLVYWRLVVVRFPARIARPVGMLMVLVMDVPVLVFVPLGKMKPEADRHEWSSLPGGNQRLLAWISLVEAAMPVLAERSLKRLLPLDVVRAFWRALTLNPRQLGCLGRACAGSTEMQRQLIRAVLAAAMSVSAVDLRSEAMAGEPLSRAAAWREADGAVQQLRRELTRSFRNTDVVTTILGELDGALSVICTSQRASGGATVAAPSGPVTPPDTRPDPSERALRERLTMQTHRPAGPIGTSPTPGGNAAGQELQELCAEALSAAAAVQIVAQHGSGSGEQALQRLEAALGSLRAVQP